VVPNLQVNAGTFDIRRATAYFGVRIRFFIWESASRHLENEHGMTNVRNETRAVVPVETSHLPA
jgi:hypothetical protein